MKNMAVGISSLSVANGLRFPRLSDTFHYLEEFPNSEYLARNTVYLPNALPIRAKPTIDSSVIRTMGEDECLIWGKTVIGEAPPGRFSNSRWVETQEGFVYLPSVQKVKNLPNVPITQLPTTDSGAGMWAEVTVPYVKMTLANPPARAPWLNDVSPELWRLYYSQVVWIDEIRVDENGTILYRVNEDYGHGFGYGDIFWAEGAAFRPITEDEISPIRPEVQNKKIIVNNNTQTVSCFEGNVEVYFCQVSCGQKFNSFGERVDEWETPVGEHWIWRKLISLHMSGGGTGAGWDTMGIPWTSLFVGEGVAIHSTYWHNDFGTARSHGCVNASPEDAKWIFRWTNPVVSLYPGDQLAPNYSGTKIDVIEPLY